ncbi:hypothetical protein HDV00_012451 [Rhizophlyctis rosea]|nr:hypothetical protein HDV00_012451 [Rhizophlyctis rosea]
MDGSHLALVLDDACEEVIATLKKEGKDVRNGYIIAKRKLDWWIGNFDMEAYRPKLAQKDMEGKIENRRVFKNAFPECFVRKDKSGVGEGGWDEELELDRKAYAEFIGTLVDAERFKEKHLRAVDQDWSEMARRIAGNIMRRSGRIGQSEHSSNSLPISLYITSIDMTTPWTLATTRHLMADKLPYGAFHAGLLIGGVKMEWGIGPTGGELICRQIDERDLNEMVVVGLQTQSNLNSQLKTISRSNSVSSTTFVATSTTATDPAAILSGEQTTWKAPLEAVKGFVTSLTTSTSSSTAPPPVTDFTPKSPLEHMRELTTKEGLANVMDKMDEAYDRAVQSFRETLRVIGSSMNVGVMDTDEKYMIVAKACTHYNTTQTYNMASNNCQTFVNHILHLLNIPPFNPKDEFAVFWHNVSRKGTTQFKYKNKVFNNRRDFDQWVSEHWETEKSFWNRRLLVCFDEMMERRFEREREEWRGRGDRGGGAGAGGGGPWAGA